jgi:hypothetical protein
MTRPVSFALAVLLIAAPDVRAQRESPVTIIAYGDTRFTDPANTTATNPKPSAPVPHFTLKDTFNQQTLQSSILQRGRRLSE